MKVLWDFPHQSPDAADYAVLTVGVFDGVHRGHARILDRTIEIAAGRPAAVVTFDPHPRAVLGSPKTHRLLSPIDERIELLRQWPLAAVAVLRFDLEVARLSYIEFVRDALMGQLGARHLVLGFDTRFGHDRAGTPERLIELGAELGYAVERVAPVAIEGQVLSSTAIRHALDSGDVETAALWLGRPYSVAGRVVHGAGRGRRLGIPTANVEAPEVKLVPAHGVYAGRTRIAGRVYAAAINVGVAPTFEGDGQRHVEAHVLDYEGALYGERLEVEFVTRLRAERRFPDAESLAAQVHDDIAATRERIRLDA